MDPDLVVEVGSVDRDGWHREYDRAIVGRAVPLTVTVGIASTIARLSAGPPFERHDRIHR
jgi:hypothetical protein